MARIAERFVDELLSRLDVADVIGRRVALKRVGRELHARCPFHDERSASFTVSPQKQFYHCFGCGAHGTAIGFVMAYESLEFVDAVEMLAGELGIAVPYEGSGARRTDGSDLLFQVLSDAAAFFRAQLPLAAVAQEYLQKRGVDSETAGRYQLGWAPADGNALVSALGNSQERLKALEVAGLVTTSARGAFCKFRERLIFPIVDRRGRAIAFGGRIIGAGEPKYLNSPETPLFRKSHELYGLQLARQSKSTRIVVVEGYMDVVSLAQFGIPECVATLGTATSKEHAELLFRSASDVLFCFDGDRAGLQAAWRALTNVLPRMRDGRQAQFLFLPDGEDPDSLVRREGQQAFRARFDTALPLSEYFFSELGKQADLSTLDGRARFAERAKPLLKTIPDGAFRDLMIAEMQRMSGLSDARLVASLSTVSANARGQFDERRALTSGARRSLVRQAIELLLANPQFALAATPPYPFSALELPGVAALCGLLELARERPSAHGAVLVEAYAGQPIHAHLLKMLAAETTGIEAELREDFLAAIEKLNTQARQLRLDQLKQNLAKLSAAEKNELRDLLQRANP